MKNNKPEGFYGMAADKWKRFCTLKAGTEILTDVFNKIDTEIEFSADWKIATIYAV
jgi:hypothetical protein